MEVAAFRNPSIIIVGSGAAGIAAATKLLKNNFTNIKVLEAENRIGGRINSIKLEDGYVDLGAEFCHGQKDNIVYSMVENLGVLKSANWKPDFRLSNGESIKKEIGEKITKFAESLGPSEDLINGCENVLSVGECLSIKLQNLCTTAKEPKEKQIYTQSSADWVNSYLSSVDGAFDLNDLKLLTDYRECKGDNHLNWSGLGFKTILDVMMKKYPNTDKQLPIDDKIFFHKEVRNISNWQNDQKMIVATTDGSTYNADHVIFTPSVGVLKANYKTLFDPPLPEEKINTIKNIGFDAVIKVIMHFPKRWWKEHIGWVLLWTTEDKQKLKEENLEWLITIRNIVPAQNNPNVLIAWYAGKHIPYIETLSDEEILEGQKYLIHKFLASQFDVIMPDRIIRTSWYSNPYYRGTYSYESVKGHSAGESKFPDKLVALYLIKTIIQPYCLPAKQLIHIISLLYMVLLKLGIGKPTD